MRALTVAALMACVSATVANAVAFPPMWPLPQSYTSGTKTSTIAPNVKITSTCTTDPDLLRAIDRFVMTTFDHHANNTVPAAISTITICAKDVSAPLQLGIDESYSLTVNPTAITLNCNAKYGCYRGLETLSQLIGFDYDDAAFNIQNLPWQIDDAPRFPHRGLLVDTSRHFLPLRTLRHIIEGMSYAKLNTMHWHIVDAIAFPFNSVSHPKLSQMGAYSAQERYTVDDVAEIVEHARTFGIRVMVEFDLPGHSGSMCYGEPDICPKPMCTSSNINNWALDITQNYTYKVVQDVMTDLTNIFFEDFLHLGGDEVVYGCWEAHQYIMDWLAARGLTPQGGYQYFTKKAHAMGFGLGRTVVAWQEVWDNFGTALDPRTVIHQWLPDSTALPLNVTNHGYRLIWSDSSVWYLDHLDVQWQEMYNAEPCNGLPDANCKLILGGEGAMWGETVDTSDHLQTIYPRLAAIAERLWSPRASAIGDNTQDRLIGFRCLLNQRDIAAAPVLNTLARQAPPAPGSCYRQ